MQGLALRGTTRRTLLGGLAGWAAGGSLAAAPTAAPPTVLSQPAQITPKVLGAAMLAVTRAGERLVAVGERGTVLLSDDHGARWQQAQAPLQVSLTCVRFINDRTGWAAGHLGAVLRSNDGGKTWHKQLDGIAAAALALRAAKRSGHEAAIVRATRLVEEGADKPFFDLQFFDAQRGLAVGAYGLTFATEDGGANWTPWMERMPNPKNLHLYGLRASGGAWVAVGEQGLMLRSTDNGVSFTALASPYQGSFFGLLHTPGDTLIAYGLRGSAWRSTNAGSAWSRLDTGTVATLSAGIALPNGGFALVTQSGDVLLGRGNDTALRRIAAREPVPVCGATVAADGSLILASLRGMRRLPEPQAA